MRFAVPIIGSSIVIQIFGTVDPEAALSVTGNHSSYLHPEDVFKEDGEGAFGLWQAKRKPFRKKNWTAFREAFGGQKDNIQSRLQKNYVRQGQFQRNYARSHRWNFTRTSYTGDLFNVSRQRTAHGATDESLSKDNGPFRSISDHGFNIQDLHSGAVSAISENLVKEQPDLRSDVLSEDWWKSARERLERERDILLQPKPGFIKNLKNYTQPKVGMSHFKREVEKRKREAEMEENTERLKRIRLGMSPEIPEGFETSYTVWVKGIQRKYGAYDGMPAPSENAELPTKEEIVIVAISTAAFGLMGLVVGGGMSTFTLAVFRFCCCITSERRKPLLADR
eukprot:gnl/MRDRNA2_/MRDRNA2_32188_c0_seq1.p1 gnl/MRDRNA2_/MRDRNA2_32188_c0~~gnl/MRDRNA2_/MRDRNA2_32188_c0_seq1.p1  ORF type:complete len:337 (-),score=52.57 gnl/MRDRNA2_/MRDRNA2_32188_c0_seq1:375-1385(-)